MDTKELLEELQKDIADLFILNEKMTKAELVKKFQLDRARQKAKTLLLAYDELSDLLGYALPEKHLQVELELHPQPAQAPPLEAEQPKQTTIDEPPAAEQPTAAEQQVEQVEEEQADEAICAAEEPLPQPDAKEDAEEENLPLDDEPDELPNLTITNDSSFDEEQEEEREREEQEEKEEQEAREEERKSEEEEEKEKEREEQEQEAKENEEEPTKKIDGLNLGKILHSPAPDNMKLEYELDHYQESMKSLDDLLGAATREPTGETPIERLIEAIGLNERFEFIADLFNNRTDVFYHTVQSIDQMENREAAELFLQEKFNWPDSEIKKQFMNLVQRRFA